MRGLPCQGGLRRVCLASALAAGRAKGTAYAWDWRSAAADERSSLLVRSKAGGASAA